LFCAEGKDTIASGDSYMDPKKSKLGLEGELIKSAVPRGGVQGH